MNMIQKVSTGKVPGTLTYVLSDATVDRYGDTIDPQGWDLTAFKRTRTSPSASGRTSGLRTINW